MVPTLIFLRHGLKERKFCQGIVTVRHVSVVPVTNLLHPRPPQRRNFEQSLEWWLIPRHPSRGCETVGRRRCPKRFVFRSRTLGRCSCLGPQYYYSVKLHDVNLLCNGCLVHFVKRTHPFSLWKLRNTLFMTKSPLCVKQMSPKRYTKRYKQKPQLQSVSIFFKFVHPCLLLYSLSYLYLLFMFLSVIFMFHSNWWWSPLFEFWQMLCRWKAE